MSLAFIDLIKPINPALLPLVSTTASVSVAIYEAIAYNGLIKVATVDKHSAARAISLWWKLNITEGATLILSLGALSLAGGISAIRSYNRGTSRWNVALAGTAFAVGHFAFAPAIAPVIEQMAGAYGDDGRRELSSQHEDDIVELQRRWLRIHAWRTLLADVPAMLCFGWLVVS